VNNLQLESQNGKPVFRPYSKVGIVIPMF